MTPLSEGEMTKELRSMTPAMRAEWAQVKRLVAPESPLSHETKVALAGLFIAKLWGHNASDFDD